MKSLTKIILTTLLLAGPVYIYARPHPVTISDDFQKLEDRHLSGFNAVGLGGSFDVYITQGSTESVKVEAPENILSHIITEVDNGVLKIYNKNDSFHWGDLFGNHQKIAVYVVAKDLNAISVSGSGDIFFKEGIRTNTLRLKVSGSGDMIGRVEVRSLETGISGSGDVKISGRADNSAVSVSGSGDFEGRGLITENTTVRVSGSGDASINASGSISAAISGSGDVRYTGGAKNVMSSKSGSGDVERD